MEKKDLQNAALKVIPILLFFVPWIAHAQPADFKSFVQNLLGIFNIIVPLIFSLAFLAFLWGVARYLVFPGGEENKTKGKQIIIWGIIAFTVMVAVWGIVNLIAGSFFPGASSSGAVSDPDACLHNFWILDC